MRHIFFLSFLVALCGLWSPAVFANDHFDESASDLSAGETITVNVVVNTEQQTVNAVEASVAFPADVLEFVASDEHTSVMSMWVQKPLVTSDGVISFSAITPGGFVSSESQIISLLFRVIKPEPVTFTLRNLTLLQNDGVGTALNITDQTARLQIIRDTPARVVDVIDTEQPEHFVPEIVSDPDMFDGRAVVIFSTKDTGSGIDHYEVKEGVVGRFSRVDGPYEIKHQKLDTVLYVKAIDRLGNERVEILYPQNWKPWYKPPGIIVTILVSCACLFLLCGYWYLRISRR